MNIQNKTILVTGAGSGIGKELVLALLEKGAIVAAADIHNIALAELKQQIGEESKDISIHVVDISDKTAIEDMAKSVITEHGHIDGVINCAGIIQPFIKINDLGYDAINKVMNINFFGTLYMAKTFLPYLLKRPEAHIVNISSMGGFLPVPGQGIYGASKAAVKLMTEALYAELIDTNVRVSVVFPGATQTNITKNSGVKVPKMPAGNTKNQNIKMTSASDAAKTIIIGIEKNKFQIFIGSDSKFMNLLYKISPKFATGFIAKQMKSLLPK